MSNLPLRRASLCIFLVSCAAPAQVLTLPGTTDRFGNMQSLDQIQLTQMNFDIFLVNSRDPHLTNVQTPDDSISKLDLKAPGKARHEYQQGYLLLMRNNPQGAIDHLTKSLAIYPQFVAAHNALGSAYLNLSQNELAQGEFDTVAGLVMKQFGRMPRRGESVTLGEFEFRVLRTDRRRIDSLRVTIPPKFEPAARAE